MQPKVRGASRNGVRRRQGRAPPAPERQPRPVCCKQIISSTGEHTHPGRRLPQGPHGARPGCTGAGSRTASESRGRLRTKGAPGDRQSRWRAGSGPRGMWRRTPGAGHSAGVSGHRHSAAYGRSLRVPARRPEARARGGRAARRDLCGGYWVTGIPTATNIGAYSWPKTVFWCIVG
jgi:hypothetical protein